MIHAKIPAIKELRETLLAKYGYQGGLKACKDLVEDIMSHEYAVKAAALREFLQGCKDPTQPDHTERITKMICEAYYETFGVQIEIKSKILETQRTYNHYCATDCGCAGARIAGLCSAAPGCDRCEQ